MSANAAAQGIPIRRIQVRHPSEIPLDYGTTPGGTMYSTTPGGTRIIYDRLFLLKCRDSPLSKTPPANLPDIPGVTTPERSPAKHIIGKIPEEGRENGEQEGHQQRYRRPNFFQYPPMHDANNNTHLQVPPSFPMKPNYGGPLAQYRQRQSISQMSQDCYPPPYAFNNFHPPPMDPQYRGVFSPPPGAMDCPFTPPPLFVHPIQGPAGPVFDHRPMEQVSQLALWRRSHSRSSSSESPGYTTAKAPQLNSSFPSPNGGDCFSPRMNFGRGRGFPRPMAPPGMRPHPMSHSFNCMQSMRNGESRGDSAYDSLTEENDLVMVIPDDPSIIAYKPLEKAKLDCNSNFMPTFSPIPAPMGVKI